MIRQEFAEVYHGGGRRWFTLQAAANAEARQAIKARCECDQGDEVTPPNVCEYHSDMERYVKIKRRLAKMAVRNYLGSNEAKSQQAKPRP